MCFASIQHPDFISVDILSCVRSPLHTGFEHRSSGSLRFTAIDALAPSLTGIDYALFALRTQHSHHPGHRINPRDAIHSSYAHYFIVAMSIPRAHPLWGQTDGGSGVYGYDGRIEHNDLPRSPNADVYSQNEEDDRSIVFTPPPSLPFPLAQRTVSLSPTTPPLTQRSVTDQIDMDLTPSSPRDSTDIEEPWEDAEQTLSRCYSAQY